MFQELESLLCIQQWPDAQQLLPLAHQHLPSVCDVKLVADTNYYKLNPHKVWWDTSKLYMPQFLPPVHQRACITLQLFLLLIAISWQSRYTCLAAAFDQTTCLAPSHQRCCLMGCRCWPSYVYVCSRPGKLSAVTHPAALQGCQIQSSRHMPSGFCGNMSIRAGLTNLQAAIICRSTT